MIFFGERPGVERRRGCQRVCHRHWGDNGFREGEGGGTLVRGRLKSFTNDVTWQGESRENGDKGKGKDNHRQIGASLGNSCTHLFGRYFFPSSLSLFFFFVMARDKVC